MLRGIRRRVLWNQTGAAMLVLLALLLLALPLLLTFAAFVELPLFAERSHQLARLPKQCSPQPMRLFLVLLSNELCTVPPSGQQLVLLL